MSPEARKKRRTAGTCAIPGCDATPAPGKATCDAHLAAEAERARQRPRKGLSFCTACGQAGHNRRNPACPAKGQRS